MSVTTPETLVETEAGIVTKAGRDVESYIEAIEELKEPTGWELKKEIWECVDTI